MHDRRPSSLLVVVLTMPLLGSCGGRSPAGPTAPLPTPTPPVATRLSVVAGDTGLPLGGVQVIAAGQSYATDSTGALVLPPEVSLGSLVDLLRPGFLDRQTLLRRDGERFALWPLSTPSGLDRDTTIQLVYTSTTEGATPGAQALRRQVYGRTRVFVFIPPQLNTAAIINAHSAAIAEINAIMRGALHYEIALERPTSETVFEVTVSPSDSFCTENILAFYRTLRTSGGEVESGLVNYCSMAAAERAPVATHELGHSLGLLHSASTRHLMFPNVRTFTHFADSEGEIARLIYQRRGGNRFPDDDRSSAGGLSLAAEPPIICGDQSRR